MRWLKWTILLCLVIAAGAAAARSSDVTLVGRTASARATLVAGRVVTFEVSCPRGQLAVSAGVSKGALGSYQPTISPIGTRGYRFALEMSPVNPNRLAIGSVACRKVTGVPARSGLRVKIVRVPAELGGDERLAKRISCPAGTTPSGLSLEQDILGTLEQARPTPRGFSFVLENRSISPIQVVFYGSCLALKPGPGGKRLALELKTFRRTASGALSQRFSASCPSGSVAFGTGFKAPAAYIHAHAAVGARGTWFASSGHKGTKVTLFLVCGRLVPS